MIDDKKKFWKEGFKSDSNTAWNDWKLKNLYYWCVPISLHNPDSNAAEKAL